jgi:hypothetical protein
LAINLKALDHSIVRYLAAAVFLKVRCLGRSRLRRRRTGLIDSSTSLQYCTVAQKRAHICQREPDDQAFSILPLAYQFLKHKFSADMPQARSKTSRNPSITRSTGPDHPRIHCPFSSKHNQHDNPSFVQAVYTILCRHLSRTGNFAHNVS